MLIIFKLIVLIGYSYAQENGFWTNRANEFVSPVTTKAWVVSLGGTVGSLIAYAGQEERRVRELKKSDDKLALSNYGYVGDLVGYGFLNATYILIHAGLGLDSEDSVNSSDYNRKALTMGKATLYPLMLTTLLKFTIKERRPGRPDDTTSFPSGHAAASFAFATVVTTEYGWGWGIPAYTLATVISSSRINDEWHYLHDVAFGATLGAAYGFGISILDNDFLSKSLSFTPVVTPTFSFMNISYQW